MWFEWEPTAHAVYGFTENGAETVAKYLEADDPLWDVIEIRTLQFTQDELMADQEKLFELLANAPFEWGTAVLTQQSIIELMVPSQTVWLSFLAETPITLPKSVKLTFTFSEGELTFTPPTSLQPAEGITIAQRIMPSMINMEALTMGNLLIEDGCLFTAESGQRQLIIWQPGYFVHNNGQSIQILDQEGDVVAEEGQPLFMGGGEGSLNDTVLLMEPIPESCMTSKVWYMGSFLPEEFRDNVAPPESP
jgi:hypothetical protein